MIVGENYNVFSASFTNSSTRGLGLGVADGADGFVGLGLLVAEGDEGEDGVVDVLFLGREALLRRGGFPCGGDADFVAQFDDDALGGFFADALDFAQAAMSPATTRPRK